MSARPGEIVEVQPVRIATYMAVQWLGFEPEAIEWLCERFGWKNLGVRDIGGRSTLVLLGKNRKRYSVMQGRWIVALGANGSLAVVQDRKFKTDYRKTDA